MADEQEYSEEVIAEATKLGWKPLEKWKGDADKWIPPDEFVEFGQKALPILQQNNRRMQQELLTRDQKLGTLETQLKTVTQQLEKLDKHYSEATKRAVEQTKRQLLTDLREARDSGDVEAEQQLLGQLDDVREALRDSNKKQENKKDAPATPPTVEVDPDAQSFIADNPWFDKDKKRTKAFLRITEDMRDEGVTTTGRAFLDEALERLEESEEGKDGDDDRRPTSKVESSNTRSSSRKSGTFASLPAEARKICHDDADIFVGEGKLYKNLKEWENEYARIYYSN